MSSRWNYRTLEEAVSASIANSVRVRGVERVALDSAWGRVISATVKGKVDVPPWNRSTVDGFALRSVDTSDGEGRLRVIGEARAGTFFKGRVGRGECVRIATGAPMPEGTDASVMFEHTDEAEGMISFRRRIQRWEEVSKKGVDIKKGAVIAEKGRVLTTGLLGALASQGMTHVAVTRKPVVAVIPGGDEIAPLGKKAGRGQIYDVNSHTISSVIERAGGSAIMLPPAVDDRESIRSSLRNALKYDACVFASGSSVGQRDFVSGVIREEGRLLFHGVRIRPGRPTMLGVVKRKPVFGLAGHPVSSFLGAHYLVGPSVRKMAGIPENLAHRIVAARYCGAERADEHMAHLLPVRLDGEKCYPVFKESGAITSISEADGIVMQPSGIAVRNGEKVLVEMLQ